jgi:hypothetical protein
MEKEKKRNEKDSGGRKRDTTLGGSIKMFQF